MSALARLYAQARHHLGAFFMIGHGALSEFIFTGHHSALFTHYRAAFILSRVRLMAAAFAVLTPLWILIDWLVFPAWVASVLAIGRVLVSLCFASLSLLCRHSRSLPKSRVALALLFLIPTAFFIFTRGFLAGLHFDDLATAVKVGYLFLPFVLLSGIALFPLTATETLVFSLPLLGAFLLSFTIHQHTIMPGIGDLPIFWLLLLIGAVGSLAALSQLQLMKALFEQSSFDPLTQTLNRRAGERFLSLQVAQAQRGAFALSVVFLDIDNFKALNDRFGHAAGDRALVALARTLLGAMRETDAVIRWGGEEFLIIMPYASAQEARRRIETILHQRAVQRPDGNPLGCSGGVAEYTRDGRSWQQLVGVADQRLYLAKNSGKGKIVSRTVRPVPEPECRLQAHHHSR